jgi:hypothetical protein
MDASDSSLTPDPCPPWREAEWTAPERAARLATRILAAWQRDSAGLPLTLALAKLGSGIAVGVEPLFGAPKRRELLPGSFAAIRAVKLLVERLRVDEKLRNGLGIGSECFEALVEAGAEIHRQPKETVGAYMLGDCVEGES